MRFRGEGGSDHRGFEPGTDMGNRGETRASQSVIAGLVPAISIRSAQCPTIGMAGTSPAMTS
jgi:hypothetical protein